MRIISDIFYTYYLYVERLEFLLTKNCGLTELVESDIILIYRNEKPYDMDMISLRAQST